MDASFGDGRTPRYADMQVPGNNYR